MAWEGRYGRGEVRVGVLSLKGKNQWEKCLDLILSGSRWVEIG